MSVRHLDFLNLAFGWCAVTSFGSFNYKTGGHLILWDLGLVIEFPPGATILIPSAVMSHSNVTIGESERRYSMTQYAAGGLFRWVENGFRLDRKLSKKQKQRRGAVAAERYDFALSLFCTHARK